MDKGTETMIANMEKNTGKTLDQWIELVKAQSFGKHGETIKFLKEKYALTHGFANLIALKAKGSDSGSAENQDDLIIKQYQGKEPLKLLYDIAFRDPNIWKRYRNSSEKRICKPAKKKAVCHLTAGNEDKV